MANSLPNLNIPTNEWVSLYDLANLPVGLVLALQNVGTCDVYLTVQPTQPAQDHDAYSIVERGQVVVNREGDQGAWAYCQGEDAKLAIVNMGGFSSPDIRTIVGESPDAVPFEIVIDELKLLNARFEAIAETTITREDIQDDDT